MLSLLEIVYLIAPSVSGYSVAAICGVGDGAGECLEGVRPPGYVFAIVWPILYTLTGISFVLASRYNPLAVPAYLTLIALLASWPIVYSCLERKTEAIGIILLSILALGVCILLGDFVSNLTLYPLLAWLLFATFLNIKEVTDEKCKKLEP